MKTLRSKYLIAVISLAIVSLTGCGSTSPADNNEVEVTSTPSTGEKVEVTSTPTKDEVVEDTCTPLIEDGEDLCRKPVIYLYPTAEQKVSVKLYYDGELTCTYPEYNDGWEVIAQPDGTLMNTLDNREYSYLYWEGITDIKWDRSKGFVVKGTDTQRFLQEKLEYMGLTPKEYNEFIVYWLPILQENPYNLITFAEEDYENIAQLKITPKPDSILRIMMLYQPLNQPIKVEEQELKPFIREGFTVVEWGGTEMK